MTAKPSPLRKSVTDVPDVSEREGLQLDRRRNLLQLASGTLLAVIGVFIGFYTTDDRYDLAALIGGTIGLVLGVFVSGFVLMVFDYPFSQYLVIIPKTFMTGLDHLRLQKDRCGRILSYLLLVLLPGWMFALITNQRFVFILVMAGSLPSLLVVVWAFRPRCPFCRATLALSWKGLKIGRCCSECGMEFTSTITSGKSS
jgi:hypothetical protein